MISVTDAARTLEERGLLTRRRTKFSPRVIDHIAEILGRPTPDDLAEFYAENIDYICHAAAHVPVWNDWIGFGSPDRDFFTCLPEAIPIFSDGSGSLYGLDLASNDPHPAVYFFDHIDQYAFPSWAAGSSLASFMLILGEQGRAYDEGWPIGWERDIDPGIEHCPRAGPDWVYD
jgi:hypothetical protein